MNGIALILLFHIFLYRRFRRRYESFALTPRISLLQRAIESRRYLFSELEPPRTLLESCLQDSVAKQIQEGRYQMADLLGLEQIWGDVRFTQEKIIGFLAMVFSRGGLAWVLALSVRLLLVGQLCLTSGDLSELLAPLLFYLFALTWLLKRLPWPFVLRDLSHAQQFLVAWWGSENDGPWGAVLQAAEEWELREGRLLANKRRDILFQFLREDEQVCLAQLKWQEELLPVGELILFAVLSLGLFYRPIRDFMDPLLFMT